ncbi:MAG TPA: hypothetical protein VMV69_13400 [Pirellulales bacterium]|nr:hypothetical protein [Pirellulales bacterium]
MAWEMLPPHSLFFVFFVCFVVVTKVPPVWSAPREVGSLDRLRPARLVSDLRARRIAAATRNQEFPEFDIDVVIAMSDEKLDVFDDFSDGAGVRQRLRRDTRPIAVMDAIVPSLKNLGKSLSQSLARRSSRIGLVDWPHRHKRGARDCEQPFIRVRGDDPMVEHVAEKSLSVPEEFVKQVLNGLEAEHGLAFHQLASGHPPAPVGVRCVRFKDCPDRKANVVKEFGQYDRGLPRFADDGRGHDIRIGVWIAVAGKP